MASQVHPEESRRFVALTEGKVSPKEVGKLYGRAEMLARMPMQMQRWIVAHAGSDEYMGFVVEPYCLFLAYEVLDPGAAEALLPDGYELVPTSMFETGQPKLCCILGAFNVHTSVFWGARVEMYLIARSRRTGMLTWVICDYESNTISYDPGEGFSGATTSRAVITTSHAADVLVDVWSADRPNRLTVRAALPAGSLRALDQPLWIEGNLSIEYGGRLMHAGSEPFGLVFDPAEMATALDIPLDAVEVEANTFGEGFRADVPFEVACFPFAQHFLTTSYPRASPIHDEEGLARAVRDHTR
jgi:hypothetical protein